MQYQRKLLTYSLKAFRGLIVIDLKSPELKIREAKRLIRKNRKLKRKKQILCLMINKAKDRMKKAKAVFLFSKRLSRLNLHIQFNKYRNEIKYFGTLEEKIQAFNSLSKKIVLSPTLIKPK